MPRKTKMKRQLQDKPLDLILDSIFIPLIFIAVILIKIGNIPRLILRILFQFLLWFGNLNLKIFTKIAASVVYLFHHLKIKQPHIKLPSLPKIKLPKYTIQKPTLPSIIIPPLPSVYLPEIPFPTLSLKIRWFIIGVFFTLIFIFLPFQIWSWLSQLPNPQLLTNREIPLTSKIFDRHGTLLYEIYTDQNRTPVTLANIPQDLIKATIAIEDKQFYNHPGFSLRGILRAAKETIVNKRLQGGSTITQQLVRSALLTPQPTLERKIKEILLSFWAERLFTKEQILEMYFNQVPYGGTSWGIEATTETYFGKSVKNLSLAEASFLAALPASPSVYSPFGTHPEQGLARQKEVLRLMREQGYISNEQEIMALNQKLVFLPAKTNIKAPHFVMYIKDLLEKKYGTRKVAQGGLQVITSLDLSIQEMAQKIVTDEITNLSSLNVGDGAALITDPKSGQILAMVGSKDYFDLDAGGNVNITLSLQQPGSSIKVVNYTLALEKGLTAASILDDSPIAFQVASQPNYIPVNYDGKFHGKVTLRQALASSFNIPAVKVLASLGVENMINQGRLMGITTWRDIDRYGLSLTLGGGDVTMLDMAKVYGVLADQGKRQDITPILKITDYKNQILEQASPQDENAVVNPGVAFILANILSDDNARSAAFGTNSLLNIPGKSVSVKTGTSNDLRDNWAIGFTPSYVVTTWVGNIDNSPMGRIASGITGATPIWHNIMVNLLKDKPNEPILPPENVVRIDACGRSEYFLKGTEKNISCAPPPTPSPSPVQ
ncbi:MAG: transglycosylase domain-containing protein [Candidatus Gottesmanbacteria bacterium]